MPNYQRRRQITIILVGIVCLGTGVWFAFFRGGSVTPDEQGRSPEQANAVPQPPISDSPYLNTKPEATFVGARRCIECHPDEHASYASTTHSRAFGPVRPQIEPQEVAFQHDKSSRAFRAYLQDGEFRHQEYIPAEGEDEKIVLCDFPVKHEIGSGNNSRSYVIDVDGFLLESPITWYARKELWDLSPGYDIEQTPGFSRDIDSRCLFCHTGRIEAAESGSRKVRFHEQRISCENCHGPGSLHVKRRESPGGVSEGIDYTIVNPVDLPRALNESICAQCHLSGTGHSYVRGRTSNDFRPGLPLTDFRIDYQLDLPETSMTVAGHFEQLHRSKCYTQSTSMTCTTCHNPHETIAEGDRVEYYRNKCLDCHAESGGCKLPKPDRLKESPMNDCTSCHMKATEIRIPHFAFTHHRIGFQTSSKFEEPKADGSPFKPILNPNEQLSELDRNRCLAIAYLNYSETNPSELRVYRDRAFEILKDVYDSGIRDPHVASALAWYCYEKKSVRCFDLADETVNFDECPPDIRTSTMAMVGAARVSRSEFAEGREVLEEVVKLRLRENDWALLGICRLKTNDSAGAIVALEKALSIRPDRSELRQLVVDLYVKSGDDKKAAQHREILRRFPSGNQLPDASALQSTR